MNESNGTKTVRVPVFDGEEESYQAWWIKFRANAKITWFAKEICTEPELDLPNSQSESDAFTGSGDETKKKEAAVEINDAEMANLTLALTSNEFINMIIRSQNKERTDGLACNLLKQLIEKHKPEGIMSLVDEK